MLTEAVTAVKERIMLCKERNKDDARKFSLQAAKELLQERRKRLTKSDDKKARNLEEHRRVQEDV